MKTKRAFGLPFFSGCRGFAMIPGVYPIVNQFTSFLVYFLVYFYFPGVVDLQQKQTLIQ